MWFRISPGDQGAASAVGSGAGPAPQAVPVEGYLVEPRSFSQSLNVTGNVLADEEIQVRTEVAGRITGIFFEEDSRVRKGDVLVRLNDAELQQEKRRILYQVNLAEIKEQRQKSLLERNVIADEDYDIALNELNTLRAQHDRVQAQIDKMQITAPFDGVIGLREVSVGSFVSPEVVIATLQKLDPVKIEFSIPERHRGAVTHGQAVRFALVGDEEERQATLYAIQPQVDTQTRTLRMRARAANPGHGMLPGAFARVEIDVQIQADALMVPSESLIPQITGYHVFVFEHGRAIERPVRIGTRTDREVVVLEGLVPRDTVITTGLLHIRDGMPVSLSGMQTHTPGQTDISGSMVAPASAAQQAAASVVVPSTSNPSGAAL